jgi:endonuclease/exonuclease/phosphatase family metal-dependent hydrolase
MFYGPTIGNTYGNLILSRYPIVSAENIPLPNPDGQEPRGLISAVIDVEGRPVTLLNTHLCAFSPANREAQVAFLREYVEKLDGPALFGADFNTRPSQQLKPLLDDGLLTSSRTDVLGLGEGIDDILVSEDLRMRVQRGAVVENAYSDHPAFWIEVGI